MSLTNKIYKYLIKPLAFRQDPEETHNSAIRLGKIISSNLFLQSALSSAYNYQNPLLEQSLLGIQFKNPVGLAAGFDKNAEIIPAMQSIGFGFTEVGATTAKSCEGNIGIRLKRFPENKSLWINLGLNNQGTDSIYQRLNLFSPKVPVGINIAKTNCKETANPEVAISDYVYSIKKFSSLKSISYLTINISCPNAYGGQPFSDPKLLSSLLNEVSKLKISKPVFLKLSPDLNKKTIDKIILLSKKHKISGFICSNLTKSKNLKSGGFSGLPVQEKSNSLISYVYKKTHLNPKSKKQNYNPIIIGVGGIFSAEDAYKKIKLGSNLVQLITGMIYEGPSLINEINRNLSILLKRDGFKNITEAVGSAHKNKPL